VSCCHKAVKRMIQIAFVSTAINIPEYVPYSSNARDDGMLSWVDLYLDGRRFCPTYVPNGSSMIA
jgi:hypothetical protein